MTHLQQNVLPVGPVGISLGFDCHAAMYAKQRKIRRAKKDGYKTGPF